MDPNCSFEGCEKEGRRGCSECRKWYCSSHDSSHLIDRYHHDGRGKWCRDCIKLEYERLAKLILDFKIN